MTLSTFLGNLPLTVLSVEMQQEQNGIFFFFSLLHPLLLGLVISAHSVTLPPSPRLGITQLSVSPLPSVLQKQSLCIILSPNPIDAFFILYL